MKQHEVHRKTLPIIKVCVYLSNRWLGSTGGIVVPTNRNCSGPGHFYLVSKEITNVVDTVLDHGGTLQRQPPCDHPDVLWQAHRSQHLGTEHTGVSDLCPFLQVGVVSENLHGGFCIGIESGFETQLGDSDLFQKGFDGADQVAERKVVIRYPSFDLVELAQVCRIHGLVTKDTIDREITGRLEATRLVREFVKHLRGHGGGVRSEQVFDGFLFLEIVAVSNGAGSSLLVHFFHSFVVVFRDADCFRGVFDEKGIVGIPRWVRLGLEERIEVPEGGFDPFVGRHFYESHFHENLSELGSHLHQRVEVTASDLLSENQEIVWLELGRLPGSGIQHFLR
mmetsp:Transcript_12918/g.28814  ORF Transcript_12918/g.28814 Transcript_12918/m.28814 type:complete len:337 (+) Transcript_12918:133-1143(+)